MMRRPVTRKSYTLRQKRDVLVQLDSLRLTGCHDAATRISISTGVKLNRISDWDLTREDIFDNANARAHRRKARKMGGWYEAAEVVLFLRFLFRRKYMLKHVGRPWLKYQFCRILRDQGIADDAKGAGASDGWCTRWLRRFDVTMQCKTNSKAQGLLERKPKIEAFLRKLRYGIQRSLPHKCPKYGRYPATHMFFGDQSPLEFRGNRSRRTYDTRGAGKVGGVRLKQPGDNKRFCTLMITLRAEGPQIVNIEIIFRNDSEGHCITQDELDYYASLSNLTVRWQKKAWSDERIAHATLLDFRKQTMELGDVALGMDNHGAQSTPSCREFMAFTDVQPIYTPAECTDCVSPVDRHMAEAIKVMVKDMFDEAYEEDDDEWDEGLTLKQKRMLVAGWTSRAWAKFSSEKGPQIREAFVKCGFLLAMDGSEDSLLDLQGWQKEWDPIKIMHDDVE